MGLGRKFGRFPGIRTSLWTEDFAELSRDVTGCNERSPERKRREGPRAQAPLPLGCKRGVHKVPPTVNPSPVQERLPGGRRAIPCCAGWLGAVKAVSAVLDDPSGVLPRV
jgi:hypothetical protein